MMSTEKKSAKILMPLAATAAVVAFLIACAIYGDRQRKEAQKDLRSCLTGKQIELCISLNNDEGFLLSRDEKAAVKNVLREYNREMDARIEKQNELRRKQEEAKKEQEQIDKIKREREEAERAYERDNIFVFWTSKTTGENTAKAIIPRKNIKTYESIGNNRIAQVIYELYDSNGAGVTSKSGFNRHEFRVNCDTREPLESTVRFTWQNGQMFTLNTTGFMSDEVCKAAGY